MFETVEFLIHLSDHQGFSMFEMGSCFLAHKVVVRLGPS